MCQVCASYYYFDVDAVACLTCDQLDIASSIPVLAFISLVAFTAFAVLLHNGWFHNFLAKKITKSTRALVKVSTLTKSVASFAQISNNIAFSCNIRYATMTRKEQNSNNSYCNHHSLPFFLPTFQILQLPEALQRFHGQAWFR